MKLYFKYLSVLLKAQMQYRVSFLLLSFGQFFVPFFVFAGMYFLFQRFGSIKGWSFFEVALCFSIIHAAFSISECIARGFDSFSNLVVSGDFDRILVRPRSTVVQVLGSRCEFSRIGRILQSLLVFIWAISGLTINWSPLKLITLFLMVFSGIFIFVGIFIMAAAICFWSVEGIEVANIFTDGGREMSQFPLDIYRKWVKRFFTFIIPFGCVNYIPMKYLLGKVSGNEILYMLAPFSGILFMIPCLIIWEAGVRHYKSTGS